MTALEKKIGVKNVVKDHCLHSDCDGCEFFNPEDETDGGYWCHIRDADDNVPSQNSWDMYTAMSN